MHLAPELQYNKTVQYLLIIALLLGFTACNQADTGETTADSTLNANSSAGGSTVTPVDGTESATSTVLGSYDQSSFSRYIYWHKVEDKILIDYNFFPEGTDFDDPGKKATLPCGIGEDNDDAVDVNANVNATTGTDSECEQIELDLALATFTIDGLEFAFSDSLDLFSVDFGFKIAAAGFINSSTSATLTVSADAATMESVYNAVLDAR